MQSAAAVAGALARAGAPGGVLVEELPEIMRRAAPGADAGALIADLRKKQMLVDLTDAGTGPETPDQILAWNLGKAPQAALAAFERVSSTIPASGTSASSKT